MSMPTTTRRSARELDDFRRLLGDTISYPVHRKDDGVLTPRESRIACRWLLNA